MMASMKVKAGVRSTIADAKVGELYPIPVNMKFCTQQLQSSSTHMIIASDPQLKTH